MKQYHDLIKRVLSEGVVRDDRTGTGTKSIFGHQMRFNLQEGFPLVTTKRIHTKSVIHELIWFLSGDSNIGYLKDNSVRIWDEWADENGDLGPVYGVQWRKWEYYKENPGASFHQRCEIDQISNLIHAIKTNPNSRRLIVSAWNPAKVDEMALPPCHTMFQFYVQDGKLSCQLYQRSGDIFLGVPFNIASYALLVHMVAHCCDLEVGDFIHTFGDAHIYLNHIDQVNLQLQRAPYELPKLMINTTEKDIFKIKFEDIAIVGYQYHPHIKGEVSI